MNRISFFLMLILMIIAGFGCTKPSSNLTMPQVVLWPESNDTIPLDEALDNLKVDIDTALVHAFASEEEKLSSTLRFIDEISHGVRDFDAAALEELKALHAQTKEAMYDEQTLKDEVVMESYDKATEDMLIALREFRQNLPDRDRYPLATRFFNEVLEADNRDFIIRNSEYNRFGIRYNELLEEHRETLKKLDNRYADAPLVPLFYGGPAI